jgi:hypothetical protein
LQNIGVHARLSEWPLWLVEGLAEYCSPPAMTKRGASWGGLGQVNPLHMATINDLNDSSPPAVRGASRTRAGRATRTSAAERLVTRTDLSPTDYALSWALTHYLATKRSDDFITFLKWLSQRAPLQERSPTDHLADFRAAFGGDLLRLDKSVAAHLAKLKYAPVPYWAVIFQQPLNHGGIRRSAFVSQSPAMIRQWIEQASAPDGGPSSWDFQAFPSRTRAVLVAEHWIHDD